MSPLLFQTVQNFFTPLLSTIFFLLFLLANKSLQSDIYKRFKLAGITVLFLVVADGIQYYCEGLAYVLSARMWAAAFGYVLRPSVIYYIFMIYLRRKSDRFRYFMSFPLILTAICAFAAFFTEKSFYYTADNILVRGPLITMPFIASFFYCIAILFESIRNIRIGDVTETVMLLLVLFVSAVATYLEAALRFSGLITGFSMVSIIMYYLFFMIDNYTHDQLTDAYQRERMYRDFRSVQNAFGVIMLDMNNLKVINDSLGHAEGDRALSTVSHAVENCMSRKSRLYRLGGDEFAVIVNADSEEAVSALERDIRNAVSHTEYSVAVGSVLGGEGESLESALSRADAVMYREKRAMKGLSEPV